MAKVKSTTKTIVKNILIILACLDDTLSMPKGFYEWHNWELIKVRKAQSWNRLIEKFDVPTAKDKVKYLKKRGYIKSAQNSNVFNLTEKGWQKIAVEASEKCVVKKEKGSKKFVILFDIPEDHRRVRDLLRDCLLNLGFDFLQKSIFISSSEKAFNFAEWLIGKCGLQRYVKFIKAEKVW